MTVQLPLMDCGLNRIISLERLPTNTTTYKHPVHRWFNFIAGFSPEFVHKCCDEAEVGSGDTLLDPFAGCGTSLVAAAERGMFSVGYEPHPVFCQATRAKLPSCDYEPLLSSIEQAIICGLKSPRFVKLAPAAEVFLGKLFSPKTIKSLLGAREKLIRNGLSKIPLAFLVLSAIVERATHSQTDGIYKAPTTRKVAIDPLDASKDIIASIREDILHLGDRDFSRLGIVHELSSEQMVQVESGTIDIIITSPPYLNNFDYAEMTRMLLYFWGIAGSWGEITERVRSKLIVNTTTALKGHKSQQDYYRQQLPLDVLCEVDLLVSELRSRRSCRAGKKEYDFLIYPYFYQMSLVLKECHRCLKNGASIHIMVADAALYGVHIAAPQLLAQIMETIGFRDVSCMLVRRRGHRWILEKRKGSSQGLGEYHISASK